MSTHNIHLNINKNITLNHPKALAMEFFIETQERVRNSRGKRATSVRATEFLLYTYQQCLLCLAPWFVLTN